MALHLKDLTAEDLIHCLSAEQKEKIAKMLELNSAELMGSNVEAEDYLDYLATLIRENITKYEI